MDHEHASPHHAPSPAPGETRVLLFDADGEDRPVAPEDVDLARLSPRELAWIDVTATEVAQVEDALRPFDLDTLPFEALLDPARNPLFHQVDWWGARAMAPLWNGDRETSTGSPWLLLVGPNVVVTVHRERIDFLEDVSTHNDPGSRLGALGADSFAAALLDRMLTAFFDAVDAFEERVDRLEVEILQPRVRTTQLPQLRKLRRSVAKLRRLLSTHRDLFDALSRPDFEPDQDEKVGKQFRAVSARYERAVDAVENARDLVVGSYELLSTRLSQRTNETMRLLTFATVLLGTLAVAAGVLGMNFKATLFETGSRGFWLAVGAMGGFVLLAVLLARWRGWWK
jgi:magnesium transporter